jgi:hypothetical protein
MLFPYCGPLTAARLVGHCRLTKILKELHKSCQGEDGADDHKKGTQLLEVCPLLFNAVEAQRSAAVLEQSSL